MCSVLLLEMDSGALCMLGRCSIAEMHPRARILVADMYCCIYDTLALG